MCSVRKITCKYLNHRILFITFTRMEYFFVTKVPYLQEKSVKSLEILLFLKSHSPFRKNNTFLVFSDSRNQIFQYTFAG